MKRRLVVGAHYGLRDWLQQRLTALVMLFYIVVMFVALLLVPPTGHQEWLGLMSFGPLTALTGLFGLALIWHAWIGVRDIWMDYVQPLWLRLTLHTLTALALFVYAGWLLFILWRL